MFKAGHTLTGNQMIHPDLCGPQGPKGGPFYLSLWSIGGKELRISKRIFVQ